MTHGPTHHHRIDSSKRVPYAKIEKPPEKETVTGKVATQVFDEVKPKKPLPVKEKAWTFEGAAKGIALRHYFNKIDAVEDKKVLKNIFGDLSFFDEDVEEHAPFVREWLIELVRNNELLGAAFTENPDDVQVFVDHLIHHVLLSAALKTLPPKDQERVKNGQTLSHPLNIKEVAAKFMRQTIEVFGKDLNEIDRQAMQGKPLDQLFRPLVEKFYDYLFPEGDSFRTAVEDLSGTATFFTRPKDIWNKDFRSFKEKRFDAAASRLAELYQPTFDRLQDKKPAIKEDKPPLPGQKESIEWASNFLIDSLISTSKKADMDFLKSRGIADPELFIRGLSPQVAEYLLKLLPVPVTQDTADVAAQGALLHVVASLARATGKNPLTSETLLENIFSHLAGMMREGIQSDDRSKPVDASSFSETSLKIMSLVIPPNNQWAVDFLRRRGIGDRTSLNQFLFQMYNAEVGEKEVKEQLSKRLGSKEGADHLEALCNSISRKSLVKIDEWFSKLGQITKDEDARLITGIFSSKDPQLQWLRDSMAKMGGSVLLKGMTHFLERIPKKEGEKFEDVCYAAFETLLKTGAHYLPDAASQLNAQKDEEAVKILNDFTQELTNLFYSPDKVERQGVSAGILLEEIQKKVVEGLADGLRYSNRLQSSKEENQIRLEKLYGSDNPAKMGDLLSHVVRQAIPSATNVEASVIAERVIVPGLASHIPLNESQKKLLVQQVTHILNKVGSEKLLENTGSVEYISQLSEASFLQFLLNFSEGIKKLEKQGEGPPLVEELVQIALRGLSDHLLHLGEAKEALKAEGVLKPTDKDIYNQYEAKNVLPPEMKDPAKKEEFYQKLSEQLFMLMETNLKNELPEIAANLIQDVFVPAILSEAVTAALTPERLHELLQSLLARAANTSKTHKIPFNKLFPTSSQIDDRLADKKARKIRSKEEYQKNISEVLGELIKNAVYLQPGGDTLGGDLLRVGTKAFRKEAAGAIADTLCLNMREGDNESQALFLGNKLMGVFLEAFPSEKNPLTGKYEYGDRDKKTKELINRQPAPNLEKLIPVTMEQKERAIKDKELDYAKAKKNVPKFIREHIHFFTSSIVLDMFFSSWEKAEEKIKGILPRFLSIPLIHLSQAFIKAPLFIVFFIVNILISILIRASVRVLFKKSVDKIAKNVGQATPEKFAYNLIREAIENVDKRRGKTLT